MEKSCDKLPSACGVVKLSSKGVFRYACILGESLPGGDAVSAMADCAASKSTKPAVKLILLAFCFSSLLRLINLEADLERSIPPEND